MVCGICTALQRWKLSFPQDSSGCLNRWALTPPPAPSSPPPPLREQERRGSLALSSLLSLSLHILLSTYDQAHDSHLPQILSSVPPSRGRQSDCQTPSSGENASFLCIVSERFLRFYGDVFTRDLRKSCNKRHFCEQPQGGAV